MSKLPDVMQNIVVSDLGDEIVVYNPGNDMAHCLGKIGAVVFRACQQQVSEEQLARELTELGVSDPTAAIAESVLMLYEARLALMAPPTKEFNRRKFLAAAGAAAAVPVVMSVMAPKPANAASCQNCNIIGAGCNNCPECVDCGVGCPLGCGGGTTTCCFEYTYIAANGPAGQCRRDEHTGSHACRNRTVIFSCTASRNAVIGQPDFTNYYCCCCDNPAGTATVTFASCC